jgi:ribonuclease R
MTAEGENQAAAGTAEAQGPVRISEDTAAQLRRRRADLLEKFDLHGELPPSVYEEAEQWTEDIAGAVAAEIDERRDLRDLTTWTTDPVDAQDFDDALSVEVNEDTYTLWVHIADVTHYVTPDTETWAAAMERGNSIYLPGHTIHMLPRPLAETVCSLVPDADRLAHTVEMTLDKEDLGYDEIEIYKSVVRSDERLTYTEAEHRLDDAEAPLHDECTLAFELADRMHEQRKADGSLVLNPRRDRAHTIIEECMLKANKAVTHELMWGRGVEAMYRVHPQPTPDEWDEALREIQELEGVSIPGSGWDDPRKAVNATLEEAPERSLPKIQRAVMRVMPRASYMADPFGGHHALNFEIYGHFTSPIRRMSDLVNHWIVHENDVPENLDQLCKRASERQQAADACEREYRQAMRDLGIDPHAVNARGLEVVEDSAAAEEVEGEASDPPEAED